MPGDDYGVSQPRTKKLSGALFQMAKQGATNHPLLSSIVLARQINRVCGTTIGPWDVDDLPDVWLDAIGAMTGELDEIRAGLQRVKAAQDRWRAQHKVNP